MLVGFGYLLLILENGSGGGATAEGEWRWRAWNGAEAQPHLGCSVPGLEASKGTAFIVSPPALEF